jgi:hypothetical protein
MTELTECEQVISVHEIKGAPLFTLLYKDVYTKPNRPIVDQVQTLLEADIASASDTFRVSAAWTTELARLSIIKLLRLNSKRLALDYHPLDKKIESKYGLKASFALPLGPLSLRDIGKLTTNLTWDARYAARPISVAAFSVSRFRTVAQVSLFQYILSEAVHLISLPSMSNG